MTSALMMLGLRINRINLWRVALAICIAGGLNACGLETFHTSQKAEGGAETGCDSASEPLWVQVFVKANPSTPATAGAISAVELAFVERAFAESSAQKLALWGTDKLLMQQQAARVHSRGGLVSASLLVGYAAARDGTEAVAVPLVAHIMAADVVPNAGEGSSAVQCLGELERRVRPSFGGAAGNAGGFQGGVCLDVWLRVLVT